MQTIHQRLRVVPTKLRPPVDFRRPLVRARLLDALLQQSYSVALVHAPAGFGKTTLLAQLYEALQAQRIPAAWLTLDSNDQGGNRLLAGVVAAVASAMPEAAASAAELLEQNPDVPSDDVIAELVEGLLSRDQSLYVVLDDVHSIDGEPQRRLLEDLIRYLPQRVHLVLGARYAPALNLGKLRMQGGVLEIGWQDLSFAADEARLYLAEYLGERHVAAQMDALLARTEGWASGLQLAALALQGGRRLDEVLSQFSGRQGELHDFLMQEVFARLDAQTQRFLLDTCMLPRMSAALCDAVTEAGDGARMLSSLENQGLFTLRLDGGGEWFRYHQLFAEFLQARLRAEDPARWQALHGRASRWFAERGDRAEALSHALEGDHIDLAARLLAEWGGDWFNRGELKTLRYWLERLPAQRLEQSPRLVQLYAWALAYLGELGAAGHYLAMAEQLCDKADSADGDAGDLRRMRAETILLRTALDVIRFDEPQRRDVPDDLADSFPVADPVQRGLAEVMLAYVKRADNRLDEAMAGVRRGIEISDAGASSLVNLLARFNEGALLILQGRPAAAESALRESLSVVRQRRWERSMANGFVTVQLAMSLADQYRNHEAMTTLQSAMGLLRANQAFGFLGVALCERARIGLQMGDVNAAENDLAEARALARESGSQRVRLRASVLSALIAVRKGRLQAAEQWLTPWFTELELDPAQPPEALTEKQEQLLVAWQPWALASKRLDVLMPVAERLAARSTACGRLRHAAAAHVALAVGHHWQGDDEKALQALQPVLVQARQYGLFTPFRLLLDLWPECLALLEPSDAGLVRERLQAAAPGSETSLHDRERQILRLVGEGLRNREIGEQLCISEETVKWYLKQLYQKLGVSNRTRALAWAREQGLL